jgi:uracil-DNA glycosylase family 4
MITSRPDTCTGCPLHTKSVPGFVPDKIVPNSDYCIVGEAPGKHELTASEPFVGDAGFVLKNWLMRAVPLLQLASERNKISYANVLHCLPPMTQGRPYPKGIEKAQAETCCTQYQQLGDAPVVILAGETPQRYFFKNELEAEDATDRQLGHDVKGVMGRIGRTYTRDGRTWVFAPHPAYILRQPALVEHGQRALAIAVGSDTILDVDYVGWDQALEQLNGNL